MHAFKKVITNLEIRFFFWRREWAYNFQSMVTVAWKPLHLISSFTLSHLMVDLVLLSDQQVFGFLKGQCWSGG